MTDGVINSGDVLPDNKTAPNEGLSNKELNFRRLEAEREKEREARIRAEMQAEAMQRELKKIEEMLKPKEVDALDNLQDISDLDPQKLKAILSQREANFKREAREFTKEILKEEREQDKKTNFRDHLRRQYQDYDSVMNEQTIAAIQEREPDAVDAISAIEDPYVRCEKAYHFFKKRLAKQDAKPVESVKEKVQENMMNPYLIPAGSATPPYSGVEFDVRSASKRKEAYEKLKAAQRRPIGNGSMAVR